jgi:CubicO group peptidase (beta-lactamase class C family)
VDKHIDERGLYSLNSLLPATGVEGKFGQPQALRDRMAYYHTPGVSIAVINDYEVEWAQGFGVCDTRFKSTVSTETLFQSGSIRALS